MQGSILVHQLRKVISLVDLLRDIGLDKQLSLPKVVVLGNQSSGKSSLLEQIVGLDFLPRGSGVVTRRPLQLRMNNVPGLAQPYAEFDQVMEGKNKKKFTNFSEVRKTIDAVTDHVCGSKKCIVDKPIILNIFSATCPNLTIVDLPGITSIPVGEQPKNIYEITRDMALNYIKQPRSIILCVIPANQDLTTSQALKLLREIDKTGERSIGCLTKIDIMNRGDDAMKMLRNQQVPLRYGYVGVKNRCQADVDNNVPVTRSLKEQVQFFTKSPIYSTLPRELFSTQSLTKKLTAILYQQIKASIPLIFDQIKTKRLKSQEQLAKLGPGVANTDGQLVNYAWKSISAFMRIYKNSINGIKNSDYSADPISSKIREHLSNLYKEEYDQPATRDLQDKDIQKAMINFPGDSTIPGFPSIDAFLSLLNPLLNKLKSPAYSLNNTIHQTMEAQAINIVGEIMIKKFPQFNVKFIDLIKKVLQKKRKELQNYLVMLLDAEISYLYTNDLAYLMGDFTLTKQEKRRLDKGKLDPLIFELRKRINSYYKLVVRNLRDLVPRQIFNFLIVKCLKQMEFQAFQFTSDVKKLKQLLNQPEEVREKRKACIKAIKVFDESQKRIKMDPQISKLIRDKTKQSKYYDKYKIKSPAQQEAQAEEQLKKQQQELTKRQNQEIVKKKDLQVKKKVKEEDTRTHPSSTSSNHSTDGSQSSSRTSSQQQSNPRRKSPPTANHPPNQTVESKNMAAMFGLKPEQSSMQKQSNPGEGVVSPPTKYPPPTNKNNDAFDKFLDAPRHGTNPATNPAQPTTTPPPIRPFQQPPPLKTNAQMPPPIRSPVTSNNPNLNINPGPSPSIPTNPPPDKKAGKPSTTNTFNQLFGLSRK